jgi:hypothetical protein
MEWEQVFGRSTGADDVNGEVLNIINKISISVSSQKSIPGRGISNLCSNACRVDITKG